MKILVTGSNGLVGQYLVNDLIAQQLDFVATSRGKNRNPQLNSSQYREMDIVDTDNIEQVLNDYHPTVVINTAAMANVDDGEKYQDTCWQVNVEGVKHLVQSADHRDIHLVHLSTDFVFDGLKGKPYHEQDIPSPVSYYGVSKLAAEQAIISSGLRRWTIVRTIVVYGFLSSLSRRNLVLWVVENLQKGQPIYVVKDQSRMPTYAGDLVKGCLAIARQGVCGMIHLSGKEQYTVLEATREIARFFDLDTKFIKPISSKDLNQLAQRPPVTGFTLGKAKSLLDYKPLSFKGGLAKMAKEMEG